jgi:hypothetical protein
MGLHRVECSGCSGAGTVDVIRDGGPLPEDCEDCHGYGYIELDPDEYAEYKAEWLEDDPDAKLD